MTQFEVEFYRNIQRIAVALEKIATVLTEKTDGAKEE